MFSHRPGQLDSLTNCCRHDNTLKSRGEERNQSPPRTSLFILASIMKRSFALLLSLLVFPNGSSAFSLRLCPTEFLSDLLLDCAHLLLLPVPGCFCLLAALSALFLFSLMPCSLFPLCLFCLYLSYLFSFNFPLSFPCA